MKDFSQKFYDLLVYFAFFFCTMAPIIILYSTAKFDNQYKTQLEQKEIKMMPNLDELFEKYWEEEEKEEQNVKTFPLTNEGINELGKYFSKQAFIAGFNAANRLRILR